MGIHALSVKLRCGSWEQLATLYERDLRRNALFLRAVRPPAVGTEVRVDLTLPSGTVIFLEGRVAKQVPPGPRGEGVELALTPINPSTLWIIESALAATNLPIAPATPPPAPLPEEPEVPIEIDPADVVEEPEAASAEDDLVTALEREFLSLRELNPFQALGLEYEATEEQAREAFSTLSKQYHPDRFARYESERARTLAAEIFILLRGAYRRIADQTARTPRRRTVQAWPPAPPRPSSSPELRPEQILSLRRPTTEGSGPLDAKALFEGVEPQAQPAPVPVPTANLEEADRLLEAGRFHEAFGAYEAAMQQRPNDRGARVGRELAHGFHLLTQGDPAAATSRFEAVLEIDPRNERAARELAALRRAATEARKGVLGRLLGRKG